jgi:hypothetical protein
LRLDQKSFIISHRESWLGWIKLNFAVTVSAFLLSWQPPSQPSNATNKSEDSKDQSPKQKSQRYAHGHLSPEID